MKKWNFLPIILVLGLLQVTILDYLRFFYARPDLLLISVAVAALVFDLRSSLIFGLFAGLLKDVFSPGVFGLNTVLFPLWGYLVFRLSRLIPIEEDILRMGLVFILTVLHNAVMGVLLISQGEMISFGIFLRIVVVQAILTALVSPLVFKLSKPAYS